MRVSVVGPASRPGTPISPRPLRNLGVGGLLGLLVGVAVALLRDRRDKRVAGADDLPRHPGIPVLATIPRLRRPTGLAGPDLSDGAPVAEAYRSLRTRVLAPARRLPRSLLVTSPAEGDGKTVTACYLAASLALAGHRVALVDANLRRPWVAELMGLPAGAGLVDVLSGRTALASTMRPWGDGHLHVLTAGASLSAPSDLLASPAMADLMDELYRSYDFVVVDSPPVTVSTDAEVLSTLVDDVLLALRHATTTQARTEEAMHDLSLVDAQVLGAVITMAPRRAARDRQFVLLTESAGPRAVEAVRSRVSAFPPSESGPQLRVPDGWKRARYVGVAPAPEARVPEARPPVTADPPVEPRVIGTFALPLPAAITARPDETHRSNNGGG